MGIVASILVTHAPSAAASTTTADIVVHAGGIRTATSTVGGLAGAAFQAVPVGGGTTYTCTTGPAGTCTITVQTDPNTQQRKAYSVSETAAPGGWYLDPNLDYGGSSSGTASPYRFQTAPLGAGDAVDVPGPSAGGSYPDATSPGSPFSGLLATSLDNPTAPTSCGLKIALVLDQSGSMAGTKQSDLKSAADAVVTALTGTPSQMAIYTFGPTAGSAGTQTLTSLATASSAGPLTYFINNLPTPSGATNWDQGLYQVTSSSTKYDLVVVLTDGNPTADHSDPGSSGSTEFRNVENGIFSANAVKSMGAGGTRLVAIGIGVRGGTDNLRAISGPTLNSDYYLGTAGNFDDVLTGLATGNCSGVLTVQKKIQDYQGNLINNSPLANGWTFAGSVSGSAASLAFPVTATVNGSTGFTQSDVTIPAGGHPTITVTEAVQSAYTFVGATCTVDGAAVPTRPAGTASDPGVSFTAAAGVPLACTFVNKQSPLLSSLGVQKLDGTTGAPVAGATFRLFREASPGTRNPALDTPISWCTTAGAPAECASAAALTFGTYYWQETVAPTGYVLPTGPAALSSPVTIDATHTGAPAATLSVTDAQQLSGLAIKKLDATTDQPVDGATFQLYRETSPGTQDPANDTEVGAVCTTAAGNSPAHTCAQGGLTFGTYYWVETAAPTGYVLPAGPNAYSAPVTIDAAYAAAGDPATLAVSDEPITTTLTVRKTDPGGNPLPGATFQLWRDTNGSAGLQQDGAAPDAAVGHCVTGSDGTCSRSGLAVGSYYWVETQAPAFYELPDVPVRAAMVVTPLNAGSVFAPTTFADPAMPAATVEKTVSSTTQNADGSWTIGYDVEVANPSDRYATFYDLTDTLAFGSGITVNTAMVTGPAGASLAVPAWDGDAHPLIIAGRPLAARDHEHYTVTVHATVGADANRSCANGGGFANESNVDRVAGPQIQQAAPLVAPAASLAASLAAPRFALLAAPRFAPLATLLAAPRSAPLAMPLTMPLTAQGEPSQRADACSEPVSPTIDKSFDSAEQHLVDGAWDGSWDLTYSVSVANPSDTTGLVYTLSDQPDFPAGVTINRGTVTGTDGTDPINGIAADWNGSTHTGIVTAHALPASGTDTYTVTVNATVAADVDPTRLPCTDAGGGSGFGNTATATSGRDTFTAGACGDITQPPMPLVSKTVIGIAQNADGTWTVIYDVAVTNPNESLASQYDLSDALDFGAGVTIEAASVIGPDGVRTDPDWNGVDRTGIVSGRFIGPGGTEDYTVTVNATVAGTATASARDCTLTTDEHGTGFLNGATVALGSQSSSTTACAGPATPTIVKQVTSVTVGSVPGTWTVEYSVTVTNETDSSVTYSLTDDPAFAAGVVSTGSRVSSVRSGLDGSGGSAPAAIVGWTGTAPDDVLATDTSLPAASKDTYTLSVDVTVPTDIADSVLACTQDGRGHGYFNEATLSAGPDTFRASACAPVHNAAVGGIDEQRPPRAPSSGASGGLVFTGVDAWGLGIVAGLLIGVGALLLLGSRWGRADEH